MARNQVWVGAAVSIVVSENNAKVQFRYDGELLNSLYEGTVLYTNLHYLNGATLVDAYWYCAHKYVYGRLLTA